MPFLEAAILRQNYRILSPVTMFFLGNAVLYVIPYFSHFYFFPNWRLNLLDYQQFSLAFNVIRCFLYTYCLVIILLLFRIARIQPVIMTLDYSQIRRRAIFAFIVFIFIVIIRIGVGVGFSPVAMIDRALHPREYTYIRAGVGPLTHLHWGFRFVLLTLAAAMIYLSGKSIFYIIFFIICSFITFLASTKSAFVLPIFMLVTAWQKIVWRPMTAFAKLRRTAQIGLIGALLVVTGFLFIKGRTEEIAGLKEAGIQAVHYHKEAYYLPLVVKRFPWSPRYTIGQIRDTFLAPIPRAIWAGKPRVGLYANYFHPEFEPKSVEYHTSTFGCLAEAHMMFGRLGPFIYGIVWALVCYKLYVYLLSHNSLFKAFLVGTLSFWTYLLLRTGFLEVNTSIILIYIFLGWIFLRKTTPVWEGEMTYDESIATESEQEWSNIDLPSTTNL